VVKDGGEVEEKTERRRPWWTLPPPPVYTYIYVCVCVYKYIRIYKENAREYYLSTTHIKSHFAHAQSQIPARSHSRAPSPVVVSSRRDLVSISQSPNHGWIILNPSSSTTRTYPIHRRGSGEKVYTAGGGSLQCIATELYYTQVVYTYTYKHTHTLNNTLESILDKWAAAFWALYMYINVCVYVFISSYTYTA